MTGRSSPMTGTRATSAGSVRGVRTATTADLPAVRTLMGHAFADDPMTRWMFPEAADAAARAEAVAAYHGLHAERYLAGGARRSTVAEADGAVVGVSLWRWPDDDASWPGVLPTTAGLLTALVGTDHAARVAAGFAAERAVRPTGTFAYLHYLAVDAGHRGRGIASALVRDGLARAAADGLPALVETTNPVNVPVYEHLGFVQRTAVRLGDDGPTVWILTTGEARRP